MGRAKKKDEMKSVTDKVKGSIHIDLATRTDRMHFMIIFQQRKLEAALLYFGPCIGWLVVWLCLSVL